MKVLITGGVGFIGSHLAIALKKMGYEITIFDNLSHQVHGKDINSSESYKELKKIDYILISDDINNLEKVPEMLMKYDFVFHLASETGTGQSMYESDKYHHVNIDGTYKLLNFYLKNPNYAPKKIILASSRAVYGEASTINNIPIASKETDNLNPLSIYAATKLYQENLFNILLTDKIDYNILRLQNVYGPCQSILNPYTGIIGIFSKLMLNNEDVFVFEDGLMSRDFVFIDDVVKSFLLVMDSKHTNQTFNVGYGESIDVITLVNKMVEILDSKSNIIITNKKRKGDIRHNFADLTKITNLLLFKPKISVDEGLVIYSEWVKKIKIINDDKYLSSFNELKDNGLIS